MPEPEPPPYKYIWTQLREGKVIPFLGAGASLINRPDQGKWQVGQSFLPTGGELAEHLATQASFVSINPHERRDLPRVASYYVEQWLDRPALEQELRGIFSPAQTPGKIHTVLASVPEPTVIITTNYDRLLELAFEQAGRPYDLVVYPADDLEVANAVLWRPHGATRYEPVHPNDLNIDLKKTSVIYKMHGTIPQSVQPPWQDDDSDRGERVVVTEEDYIDFLARLAAETAVPKIFFRELHNCHFLFLGYSLRDWNLRVMLKCLAAYRTGRRPDATQGIGNRTPRRSWAIQRKPQRYDEFFWRKREVTLCDLDVDDFAQGLRDAGS